MSRHRWHRAALAAVRELPHRARRDLRQHPTMPATRAQVRQAGTHRTRRIGAGALGAVAQGIGAVSQAGKAGLCTGVEVERHGTILARETLDLVSPAGHHLQQHPRQRGEILLGCFWRWRPRIVRKVPCGSYPTVSSERSSSCRPRRGDSCRTWTVSAVPLRKSKWDTAWARCLPTTDLDSPSCWAIVRSETPDTRAWSIRWRVGWRQMVHRDARGSAGAVDAAASSEGKGVDPDEPLLAMRASSPHCARADLSTSALTRGPT
jgi:hypothetical protein